MWRTLFTRYGIGLLLFAVVVLIVAGARLFGGAGSTTTGLRDDLTPLPTVAPTAGDDGETSPLPAPTLVVSPGAAPPDRVAAAFAAAWTDHRGVSNAAWVARLKPHATPELVAKLAGVDPAGVPADRVTGAVQLLPRGEQLVEAVVPVDSGTLRLRLTAPDGRWFVDGVDWGRT
ncbi:MAG TPA: hypothetical protein VFB84_20300 [Micromonosporaceae bacterium]|nr:hypothetical protein [Micromonosporaceae bacterium]